MCDVPTVDEAPAIEAEQPEAAADDAELISDELIVEDVSIDGMCGVY